MAEAVLKRRSYLRPALGFALFVLAPTVLAAWYYFAIHADRYVTEFRYSVRGGAALGAGTEAGLTTAGSAALVLASDSFVLEDYLRSVQAFEDIEHRLPLREMLARDGGDPVRRFDPALPAEHLLPFWERAVNVRFDALTGITTAEVSLYRAEDSLAVAKALVGELRLIVDGLSKQARDEMLAYVNGQLTVAEAELNRAREAMESFRREYRTFSPEESMSIETEISSGLSTTLATKRVEMRTLIQRAPNSPRLAILADEIDALQAQLLAQYEGRETGGDGAMAARFADFEEREEDYELARQTYVNTFALKQEAEANAALNQAQLVVFVKPRLPTLSTDPDRPLQIGIVFGVAFLIWLIARIFIAGVAAQ